MRVVHIILGLLFLSFTVVQFNDPDPILWILIYGSMTVLCGLAVAGKLYRPLMVLQLVAYLVYAFLLGPGMYTWWTSPDRSLLFDDLAKMQYYYIEEAREFLGLMICLMVLGYYIFLSRKQTAN